MVGIGNIVSVAGAPGSGGGSGITSINAQTGPAILLLGTSGIRVITSGNSMLFSGENIDTGGSDGSGINAINGDLGPNIDIVGVNGIDFSNPSAGIILGDVSALSGIIPVTSGVESLNGQSGPHITAVGVNGIEITAAGNEVLFDGVSLSGIFSIESLTQPDIDLFAVGNLFAITTPTANRIAFDFTALSGIIPVTSGIESVNGQSGPHITNVGVNGIGITAASDEILFDGSALSGLVTSTPCFTSSFSNTTSGAFDHSLGTRNLVVEIYDDSSPPELIIPDKIVYDTLDRISLLFNGLQSGNITIIACGGSSALSVSDFECAKAFAFFMS